MVLSGGRGELSLEVDGWGDMGVESCCLVVHEVP